MTLRCLNPWFGTGRVAVLDAGFGSIETVKALKQHGLHTIANVKQMSDQFPRSAMLSRLKERHATVHFETDIIGDGKLYKLYASGH